LPPPRWEPGTLGGGWPGAIATLELTDGIAWCNSNCRFADIIDGMSLTIMIGERSALSSNARWFGVRGNQFEYDAVSDLGRHSPINGGLGSFSSMHEGGAHFAFCDGAVRFLSEDVNDALIAEDEPLLVERLATRNGREVIGAF
jgi:prepilin-type processing-associated H-X9-DG protein